MKRRLKRVTIIVAFHFMKRRLKKSHYNSRVSLHEAPTKKELSAPKTTFHQAEIRYESQGCHLTKWKFRKKEKETDEKSFNKVWCIEKKTAVRLSWKRIRSHNTEKSSTILDSSGVSKKKRRNAMTIVYSFLRKAPTKNESEIICIFEVCVT